MPDQKLGVLFDLDGVLIDSGEFHFRAWEWLADRDGVPFSRSFFDQTFGMPNRQILPRMYPDSRLTESDVERLGEEKESKYREFVAQELDWMPGARELVDELAADEHWVVGLFTSTPRSNLEFIDQRLALSDRMAVLLNGSEVANGKPAPDGYLELARRLEVQPERGVVIEDAPAGIEAGNAGGFHTVGLATTHEPSTIATADHVFTDPSALTVQILADIVSGTFRASH